MASFIQALVSSRKRQRDTKEFGERGKEIISILAKYDYSAGITPQMVVGILEDLGPTFVKLGQIASTHADMLPQQYCDALASLRSSVAPMDARLVHEQIEKYLGRTTQEVFVSFDDVPLGSASIGQVHKAELADGTVVAVKVRRPGVVETVAQDFALIERVLGLTEMLSPGEDGLDFRVMVEELEKTSKIELDFTNEARNLERFYADNKDRTGVHVPKCFADLSNEAVLVEEFVSGHEVGESDYVSTMDGAERDRLGYLLADNYVSQILEDGFYHADPHAGNVLLRDGEIVWIDFGMMGMLTSKERQTLLSLVTALVRRDNYGLKRCVLQIAKPKGPIDHGALLDLCEQMTDQFADSDLESFDTSALLNTIMDNLEKQGYDIEPFLTNLARGLITVEGTLKALSPRVNIMECMSRHVPTGVDPVELERLVMTFLMKGAQSADDLVGLPTKAYETLDMLQKSQLKVGGDLGIENRSLVWFDRVARDHTLSLMASSLFLGSCLLCLTDLEPRVFGVPMLGFLGFVFAIVFMVYVYMSSTKGRR